MNQILEFFLHLDEKLIQIVGQYGTLTYVLLFLVIFAETGLVVTPFLPGDSLLFAAGTIAAAGALNIIVLWLVLCAAAILGDTVNYWIGHFVGPRAFRSNSRFLKKEYLDRTHAFYEKHGGKTIILARFMPIIRTFAPVVAGVGTMEYRQFVTYNVIGGFAWVWSMSLLGYGLGSVIPDIDKHIHKVIAVVVFLSILPGIVEWWRHRQTAAS